MILKNGDRIVFAGDSVTDAGSLNPVGEGSVGDNLGRGYVRMIDNLIHSCYPELKIRITNSGISGNKSRDLLERFDRDVISLNPDWVSICIGINDVWRHFDTPSMKEKLVCEKEYEENLEKMIIASKNIAKGVFVMSPYYIEPSESDCMRKKMDKYGQICKVLSGKYGCIFVDLQEVFTKFCNENHSSFIAWDRVHPNMIGATLIAKAFLGKCGFDYNHIKEL